MAEGSLKNRIMQDLAVGPEALASSNGHVPPGLLELLKEEASSEEEAREIVEFYKRNYLAQLSRNYTRAMSSD